MTVTMTMKEYETLKNKITESNNAVFDLANEIKEYLRFACGPINMNQIDIIIEKSFKNLNRGNNALEARRSK